MTTGNQVLLRADECASLLRIGRTKVYGMLAAGELPSVRIGQAVRVPLAALLRWIEDRTDGPITPEPAGDTIGPAAS